MLNGNPQVCSRCYLEMTPKFRRFKADGVSATAIFSYNQAIRSMLYQFKGCGDYELRDCFLNYQSSYLNLLYRGYYLVGVPSSKEGDATRGFNHVKEIFSFFKMPWIDAIEKLDATKQSSLSAKERQNVASRLSWAGKEVSGKKILLLDDVYTTGSTIKACIALLKEHKAAKIKVLVMSKTELST